MVALLVSLLLSSCGDGGSPAPSVSVTEGWSPRLAFDAERVELLDGFEGHDALSVFYDYDRRFNPDRSGLPVALFRRCRLRWNAYPWGGRLLARVGRLAAGTAGDDSPAALHVRALKGGEVIPGSELVVPLPALPEDPYATPSPREGPLAEVVFETPMDAEGFELQLVSPDGVPNGGLAVLVGARIDSGPQVARLDDLPLAYDQARRLAGRAVLDAPPGDTGLRLWGETRTRVDGDAGEPPQEVAAPLEVAAVEATGAFLGRDPRMGLALHGGCAARVPLGEVRDDHVLRTALALDDRLAPGTAAEVVISVGDRQLARVTVDSDRWTPLEVPLASVAGPDVTLRLAVSTERIQPDWVVRDVPDYGAGKFRVVGFRLDQARVGFADLRLSRPVQVARHAASPERPSVVLLHVETLRADVVGARDADGALVAPHLTAMARAAGLYAEAVAPSPWTVPSTASLFTGLPPSAHGARTHHTSVIADGAETLAERARAAGVVTGAVVTNDLLRPHAGWARGFDDYRFAPYANARQVFDQAWDLIAGHGGQQTLTLLHLWDPHGPCVAPEPWRDAYVEPELRALDLFEVERGLVDALLANRPVPGPEAPEVRFLHQRYLGEVAWLDAQLGRFLDGLHRVGYDQNTTVALTSDHGEEFLEHGLYGHGSQVFDESTRVPLIVLEAGPGGWGDAYEAALGDPDGQAPESQGVVTTTGLHAEVLRRLGVPFDREAAWAALSADRPGMAYIETEKGVARDPSRRADPLRRRIEAVRSGSHLLVIDHPVAGEVQADGSLPAPRERLFDLIQDPGAERPLAAEGPEADQLREHAERVRDWSAVRRVRAAEAAGDSELMRTLQQFGYVGSDREDG